ncbi:MAG TPA: hypothetical protein VFD81_19570 [Methylomirabilota bacterium]|nr:hypothetical protein [Methylomirabilota bacterium]
MVAIRLVLLLILSMALEVAGPLGPDVMESLEGSQEAARASAHPRLRLDRDVHAPSKGDPDRATAAYRPSAVAGNHNRPLTGAWVRKLPPAASDSASSPEDH